MAESIVIDTPGSKINYFVNEWLKRQVQLCAEVGGSTMKGFRDQLQDAWVTRTAGWMLMAIIEYMLGFYPRYDIISIRPCIPTRYELAMDGERIEGDTIKICSDGKAHRIVVKL